MKWRWLGMTLAVLLLAAGLASAQYRPTPFGSNRTKLRAYVGATAQQYDTLGGGSGQQVTLEGFSAWTDDSAQTGQVLNILFVSSNSKTEYLRFIVNGWAANGVIEKHFTGKWTFPNDSTILAYYNITGATPATLDTVVIRGSVTIAPSR